MTTSYIKNKNIFINDMHWDIPSLRSEKNWNPPEKMFLSENVIFRGLRLSLDHFGQQAPESPMSQLPNGVSTSALPPFIVDLFTFIDYPRSNSFFQWEFWRVLKGKPRERPTLGRNSSAKWSADTFLSI